MLTTYKILSNMLLSRLTTYAEEIIGDHQCGFRRNKLITDHKYCIRQILEKKWEYNEAGHQLFIDIKKDYNSVRREVLCHILSECGIHLKLVKLIKMCQYETYSRDRVRKYLTCFLLRMAENRGALSSLFFNFAWGEPLQELWYTTTAWN